MSTKAESTTTQIKFKSILAKVYVPSCLAHMTIQNALAMKYIRLLDEHTAEFTQPYNQIRAATKGVEVIQ